MKSHGLRAIGILWLLAGVVWLPAPGWAQAPVRRVAPVRTPPRVVAKRIVVMLAARNQAAASKELHQAVNGQLSDASVALELRWVSQFAARPPAQLAQARKIARGRKIVVVFWCDLSAKGESFLYLVEPSKGRLIMRSVARTGGGGRAESVAIIVGMSVRALVRSLPGSLPRSRARPGTSARRPGARRSRPVASVRGRRPGEVSARRPVMPLTADNPLFAEAARLRKERPPPAPRWLLLEMGYAMEFYGRKQTSTGSSYPPSHGVSIALAVRFAKLWTAFVSFRVTEPIKVKGDPVQISLQRYPLSTGARFRHRLGRWVELGGALSFSFDYVAVDIKVPEGWPPPAIQNKLHFMIGGEVQLAILAVDRVRFLISVGAEVGLNPVQRIIPGGDADQAIIIDPWPVQPYFRFGISLDLI